MPSRHFLFALHFLAFHCHLARAQNVPAEPLPPRVVAPDNGAQNQPQNGTSDNNRNSPRPPEADIGPSDVNAPIPSINSTTITPRENVEGQTSSQTVLTPYGTTNVSPGTSSPPSASTSTPPTPQEGDVLGQEAPGGGFDLSSPNGVIYDMERGIAFAQGDVTFSYREFVVRGRRGVIDYNNNTATLSDNLTVMARSGETSRVFTGESLVFNLDSGAWTLSKIQATFPPELFPPGQVLEPLYLRDGRVIGADENVRGEDFTFSSCDRDHYYIRSKRLTFYRDANGNPDRIALKRNGLYLFGRKILPLPAYVLSLQGARSRRIGLQPTFGQNEVDGFFAKTVVDLAASNRRTDSLLVDVLQKRGLGLGLQRELAGGAGLFYLYALSGKTGGQQIDSRIQRNFRIAQGLTGNLDFNSTQNNSLSGEGYSARNGTLNFNYANSAVQSNLLLTQNQSGSPFNEFSQQSANFTHRQQFGTAWDLELASLFNSSASSGSEKLSTLDNTIDLNRRGSRFDALLRAELHDDLTGRNQVNGAYQLERLPELTLSSSTDRLGIGFLNRFTPGQFNLAMGRFSEPSSLTRLNRTDFDFTPNTRTLGLINGGLVRSQLDIGGNFGQSFYSNDTARYDYTFDVSLNTGFGRRRGGARNTPISTLESTISGDDTQDNSTLDESGEGRSGGYDAGQLERLSRESYSGQGNDPLQLRVNYLKLRPVGFTPFQFDFVSPNEFLDVRGIFEPSRKLRLEVAGGRDIGNGITRDLTGVLRLAPSRSVDVELATSYSLENSEFGDVTANLFLRRDRRKFAGGALSIGVRYSPQNSTFSTINAGADLQLGSKTRFQGLVGYNGFAKEFDIQQFRIVRDVHCFNLFATYDGRRKEFRLDLALKAFPFIDSRLGQNEFGTGFDPAIGSVR